MKFQKQLISKDHPDYEAIGEYIQSKESVVGIDARHTDIVIIKKLMELEKKITSLEKKLSKSKIRKKK